MSERPVIKWQTHGSDRVGDADRNRVVAHITHVAGLGYMSDDEREARITRAFLARTQDDLLTLTRDVPPMADHTGKLRAYLRDVNWDKPHYWAPAAIMLMFASALTAIMPVSLLSAMHDAGSPAAVACWVPLVIAGVAGFITGLAVICAKA